MYQCYFTDKTGAQCQKRQEDCWCSQEHKEAWQDENYGDNRVRGEKKLSIKDIQKGLKQIQEEKRLKRFEKQQKLL